MGQYDLRRFVSAQEKKFPRALAEIQAGRKKSHWMWYIFPQLRGLGQSDRAVYYGISGLEEAKAYLEHPYLRQNLLEITSALLTLSTSNPTKVMGEIDDEKLCSSMTLFEFAAPDIPQFGQVLEKFYAGNRDGKTLTLLRKS